MNASGGNGGARHGGVSALVRFEIGIAEALRFVASAALTRARESFQLTVVNMASGNVSGAIGKTTLGEAAGSPEGPRPTTGDTSRGGEWYGRSPSSKPTGAGSEALKKMAEKACSDYLLSMVTAR